MNILRVHLQSSDEQIYEGATCKRKNGLVKEWKRFVLRLGKTIGEICSHDILFKMTNRYDDKRCCPDSCKVKLAPTARQ